MADNQPILVPTDFTDKALNAARYALALAKVLNKEVYLSHAYAVPSAGAGHFTGGLDHALEAASKERLQEIASELETKADGVPLHYLAVKSEPIDGVEWASDEVDAGLLIMGIQHTDTVGEVLVGSVVTGVIRRDTPPLIVVPENFAFRPLKKIVVATDFKLRPDTNGMAILNQLQQSFGAEITFVHVDTEGREASTTKKPFLYGGKEYECNIVHSKDVVTGTRSYLDTHSADLLVMVPGKHNLFQRLMRQSNTRRMVFNTGYPLLILEAEK